MDFRFVCLVVLAVASLAASAPVAQEVKLEKRAQEVIAYGNQQNAPRLKKRDPALAEGKSDVDSAGKVKAGPVEKFQAESSSGEAGSQDSGEADAVASIKAAAAESAATSGEQTAVGDVPEVGDDDSAEMPTNMAAFEESMMGENAAQVDNELPDDSPAAPSSGDDVDDLLSQLKSEAEATEKEDKEGKKEENETTALAKPEDLEEDYQNYFTNYNLLRKYNSMLGGQGYRAQYPGYTQYYRRRRSALAKLRRARRLAPHGRRIKRDLMDDNEVVYLPYGLPPQYLSQAAFPKELYPEQWESPERPDPEEEQREEILAELMAMKEEEEREEEEEEKEKEMLDLYSLLYGGGYGEYEPYLEQEQEPELEQEEEEYPLYKRQLLSEMPGLKKRYFFPYAQEPETHWPAFVPQKRQYDEYGDAYAQVMRLAQELALEEPRDLDNYFNGEKK